MESKNIKTDSLTNFKKDGRPSSSYVGKCPTNNKLTGSLCGSDGSTSYGSKPRLMARDSKLADESAGFGGSTSSEGKTVSSPDK
jgi:hypothetical protein